MRHILKITIVLIFWLFISKYIKAQPDVKDTISKNKDIEQILAKKIPESQQSTEDLKYIEEVKLFNKVLLVLAVLMIFLTAFLMHKWRKKTNEGREQRYVISNLQNQVAELLNKLERIEDKLVEANEKPKESEDKDIPLPFLLDNKPFVKLVEETVDIIKKLESYKERVGDNETALMITDQSIADCKDALERCEVERIADNIPFNTLFHEPVPLSLVKDGTQIGGIIDSGLKIENRVFLKAKVIVKE